MAIDLSIVELSPPRLQFGGASAHTDPKAGLLAAGPFDLRFGSARKDHVHVGIIGPAEQVAAARRWLERCGREVPVLGEPILMDPVANAGFGGSLCHCFMLSMSATSVPRRKESRTQR